MKTSRSPATGANQTELEPARPRWSGYVALVGFLLYFVFATVGWILDRVLLRRGLVAQEGDPATLVALALFVAVGAILVWLVPRNPVGWVFFGIAWGAQVAYAGVNYGAYHAQVEPLPLGAAMAWISNWAWYPVLASVATFLPLYFPTGRLLTARWRWVVRLTVVALFLMCFRYGFAPGELDAIPMVNPLGIGALGPYTGLMDGVAGILLAVAAVLSLVSAVLRFKRSRGQERQQMKWFVMGIGLFIALVMSVGLIPGLEEKLDDVAGEIVFAIFFALIPISAAMAVLKYKLYAIDTVINRVLVYGVLTAILVGTYLVAIVGLQSALAPLTRESDLAVAVSTLAVAAAFRPLRSRVQRFIDRRFYRHKYDATELLTGFAARLRNEVDLDAAHLDILEVVRQTMQPQHASLWVAPSPPTGVAGGGAS